MQDLHALDRFLQAQAAVYEGALAELKAGRKHGHWMWFIFPQLRALGHSENARYYGIASRAEARAYAEHELLCARLKECTSAVLAVENKTAHEIFGTPDDLKFRSSITLFAEFAPEASVFRTALDRFFEGVRDVRTMELLERS
jgi:uncharacterized protein (DUF1810 family)